jgi:hypothetical protein
MPNTQSKATRETLERYADARQQFEAMASYAFDLVEANSGRNVDSWREEYGSYIFSKIVLHGMSALMLAPDVTGRNRAQAQLWDPASLASLIRALIDTYFVFYYVACDEIDEDESQFRHALWHFHGERARLRKLEKIGSANPRLEQLRQEVESSKRRVTTSSVYAGLETDVQKGVRQGRSAFLLTNSEIANRAGFSASHYKATYDFLSSYIHTLPFSLSQIAGFHADQDALVRIYKIMVDYGSIYLSQAISDFVSIFGESGIQPSREAAKAIDLWQHVLHNFGEKTP